MTPEQVLSQFQATGVGIRARVGQKFTGSIALFSEPHTRPQEFEAVIDWGDGSASSPGRVRTRGSGRFAVNGSHRYIKPGMYNVTVTIHDLAGKEIAAASSARVLKK